ncbi:hypothetical protein CQ14_29435 [Bradyrhizobium lablabi]|uniref:Uncharacterized protein n=1 Tax=Bradyrhizobium lablabi TaxID=722472 RepID=A0A0R3N6G6_9BRAD|nr:hypothetical protein CQ14_29435 [Bradyrhizobium lablabi]
MMVKEPTTIAGCILARGTPIFQTPILRSPIRTLSRNLSRLITTTALLQTPEQAERSHSARRMI